jgi:4-methylaminobutanoate oxidase (formaldehyde-forming)
MSRSLPGSAQYVIIGGGIIGCSTAYHLAREGAKEVILLERAKLTSGSTFHAAGLVGQLRSSANVTQLLKYSVELYNRLEAETGLATGWKQNGGLRLACNEARMIEIKRQATTGRSFGLEMELLGPREAQSLWPLMDISDVLGAVFLPGDGQANPSDITQALAKGARQLGVRIFEDSPVTGIHVAQGRVTGVETAAGTLACEKVVNCAGQWAREVGALVGVSVPLVSVQHQYLVSERIPGIEAGLATLRDPDRLTYFKEEVGGLVMGGYEPNPIPWAENGIPEGFEFNLLNPDLEHFEPLMQQAIARVPALAEVGIKQMINGPESFTPDGNFILGEAPELRHFYVGAGFNAFGIASAGGAGRALAEWVLAGEPPMDLWAVDIRRFGPVHRDVEWVRTRTLELYGKHYTVGWPFEEHESGRPQLKSPIYDRLAQAGACFGSKLGWERPNWFARPGETPKDVYSFGRQNWFEAVGEEHRACREQAALFDQSSFAKFYLEGEGAEAALQWICANDLAKPMGRLTYTQMLNERGGIECDLTVARQAPDRFYVVTGTGFRSHDADWIRRNLPAGSAVRLRDVTEEIAVLALMGPRAREILCRLSNDELSNSAFPFATCREIRIAGIPVWMLRVTYVGELGWELHMARKRCAEVYGALLSAGVPLGLRNAGYRAIESLRLEKGYRAWGTDIGPDHTPLEAGLGWAVKLASGIPFEGREALLAQRERGLRKRLAGFTVEDPEVTLLGRETIFRDGNRVGWLTSGGWGYTVQRNIGYGYVRDAGGIDESTLLAGTYQLEVATERVPCQIHLAPLYDPKMAKVKG